MANCPKCGAHNPQKAKFCHQCGTSLIPAIPNAAHEHKKPAWWKSPVIPGVLIVITFTGIMINLYHPFGLSLTFKNGLSRMEPTTTVAPATPLNEVVKETRAVLKKAAEAIATGDKAAFVNQLDTNVRAQIKSDLNLALPEAKKLAQGLTDAKVMEIHSLVVFYQMTVDSETYSFYVSKEGNEWKIGGF